MNTLKQQTSANIAGFMDWGFRMPWELKALLFETQTLNQKYDDGEFQFRYFATYFYKWPVEDRSDHIMKIMNHFIEIMNYIPKHFATSNEDFLSVEDVVFRYLAAILQKAQQNHRANIVRYFKEADQ